MRLSILSMCGLGLTALAGAQVSQFVGPSPNLTTVLDFDTPAAPLGPIAGNSTVFTSVGITGASLVGTWAPAGDTLTIGSNVNGSSLISQNGVLTVGASPDPLDGAALGAGFEFTLANAVDEFQCIFADQVNHSYTVELFNGATSLGSGTFIYAGAFPNPPHYWRGPSPFNRIRITINSANVGVGLDEIAFGNGAPPPPPPPLPPTCAETTFAAGNGGNIGGNVFFDVTVTQPITVSGLLTHFSAAIGTPVGLTVWTAPSTYVGNELNAAAWTQAAVDNGASTSAGLSVPTPITFAAPLALTPGTYGFCLQASGSAHSYTNGTGTNQSAQSSNGVISLSLGAAQNTPFTSAPFTPRVWNGRFCMDGMAGPGMNYCTPSVPNSTGSSARITATGSNVRANNDLTLQAQQLPNNAFGFFLTSRTQGTVNQPGGSQGVLCLSGGIGRYVGPGQIKNSGATGSFSLQLNLATMPTPTGPVSAQVGETWNFTTWYRDAVGGQATSNFTDGYSVTFQ